MTSSPLVSSVVDIFSTRFECSFKLSEFAKNRNGVGSGVTTDIANWAVSGEKLHSKRVEKI